MQLRFIFSDESSATLTVNADESVSEVSQRLLISLGKTDCTANWLFLGSPISQSSLIAETSLTDGCTVNVFLRPAVTASRDNLGSPANYSSKLDQILLRVGFLASFIIFAGASYYRAMNPGSFTFFTNIALNGFWTLWAITLSANWRSLAT